MKRENSSPSEPESQDTTSSETSAQEDTTSSETSAQENAEGEGSFEDAEAPKEDAENWIFQQGWRFLNLFLPKDPQAQIEALMARLREEMPAPCVLLLGEPQVGKSSVVRSLTQDPEARIGDGDGVPVTDSLSLYDFPPNSELPLWRFLDTPGLGGHEEELQRDQAFVRLLLGEETWEEGEPIPTPHILLVCVRADDRMLGILPRLERLRPLWERNKAPLSVLVVQTNLHRLEHPHPMPYPFGEQGDELPDTLSTETRERLSDQRERFREVVPDARFVVIDLTDPEDEVGDPLYGALPLFEAVLQELPEITERFLRSHRESFSEVYREGASAMILHYAMAAGMAGALPPPVGDIGTLALTLTMMQQLAQHHKQSWQWRSFLDMLWSLGSTSLLWLILRYMARRLPIPVLMAPVGAAGAFTLVYSLGELMSWYYSVLKEGHKPHEEEIQQHWQEAQANAAERAREWLRQWLPNNQTPAADPPKST